MAARNRGAAVLLVSEDLDELLELSDRLVVMFHGQLVYETRASEADLTRSAGTWQGIDAGPCRLQRSICPAALRANNEIHDILGPR